MAKKYIDEDLLRKEIERRIKSFNKQEEGYIDADCETMIEEMRIKRGELRSILSFIDSLQQEQPSEDLEVKEQIEELANDWHHKGFASDEDCPLCMQDLIDILWHFYELGKRAMKRQMLKDAVEGKIYGYDDGSFELIVSWLDLPKDLKFKDGDQVKIVVIPIKEDKK